MTRSNLDECTFRADAQGQTPARARMRYNKRQCPRTTASLPRRWRAGADEAILVVEQRHAEACEQPVDRRLVLRDQPVELPLPLLIGSAHPHRDVVGKPG